MHEMQNAIPTVIKVHPLHPQNYLCDCQNMAPSVCFFDGTYEN